MVHVYKATCYLCTCTASTYMLCNNFMHIQTIVILYFCPFTDFFNRIDELCGTLQSTRGRLQQIWDEKGGKLDQVTMDTLPHIYMYETISIFTQLKLNNSTFNLYSLQLILSN